MEQLQKSGYLCHPMQAYTLRRVTLNEGKAKGASIIEVCTAGGLQVDIFPDSGLDIGQVRYKGNNMSFICKNGYDSPVTFIPHESNFLNTYPGGMMYTCGLRNVGPGNRDNGEYHDNHGRYHGLAAEQVGAYVEDDTIIIRGVVRESALFGHCLQLTRIIRIPIFGAKITVSDELCNLAHQDQEYMILYHCNFGYPFLSEKAHLVFPEKRKTTGRTPFAADFVGKEHTFDAPVPGEEERCFFHEEMERKVSLVNEALGAKMTLTWSETLPILVQWRTMASGDYALGLEPTNNYINGRSAERENGTLPVLKAHETVKTEVSFNFETI